MSSQPQLDRGFFQKFVGNKVPPGCQPTLQIMQSRQMSNASVYRLRMSDGDSYYTSCTLEMAANEAFEQDGLDKGNAVIRVTEFRKEDRNGKRWFHMVTYEVIARNLPIIGESSLRPCGSGEEQNSSQEGGAANRPGAHQSSANSAQHLRSQSEKRGPAPSSNDSHGPSPKRRPMAAPTPSGQPVTPIDLLTPYVTKWRICGVVSAKSEIKEISNARGNFRVFNFIITDAQGSAIRVSCFGDSVDEFIHSVNNGETYLISGTGGVVAAKREFNPTAHSYELRLNKGSTTIEHSNYAIAEPPPKLHAVQLAKIPERVGQFIDVVAIIRHAGPLTQVVSKKDNKQLDKRDIYLIDQSGAEVAFTLWDKEASNFDESKVGSVVAIKGASVRQFNETFSLSANQSTTKMLFDSLPNGIVAPLVEWYASGKNTPDGLKFTPLSSGGGAYTGDYRMIGNASLHNFGKEMGKAYYMNVVAIVTAAKSENAIYQACPTETCKKKVVAEGGQFRCEKCDKVFADCKHLMMLQLEIADSSGSQWVTMFDDQATVLLGMKANDLVKLRDSDESQYKEVFDRLLFHTFDFRISAKWETYNDQHRQKWSVMRALPPQPEKILGVYKKVIDMEGES